MTKHRATRARSKKALKRGGGILSSIVNKTIDILPTLHIPGYNYCGPGTPLRDHIAKGVKPINKLDESCKLHDEAYERYSDSANRNIADKELVERAWSRVKSSDASLKEKLAAWAVTNIMKGKTLISGAGKRKCKKKRQSKGRGLYLKPYIRQGSGKKKVRKPKKKSGKGVKRQRTLKKKS